MKFNPKSEPTKLFLPKPGDKIICNNGDELICCSADFLVKDGFDVSTDSNLIYGYQPSKHGLYQYGWTFWDESGVHGDEGWCIREVIPAETKEVMKEGEEPRYTVEEVFYAIKQYVGYESPLDYKDGIKRLLKNLDEDPQYKEYLRLKAIYE